MVITAVPLQLERHSSTAVQTVINSSSFPARSTVRSVRWVKEWHLRITIVLGLALSLRTVDSVAAPRQQAPIIGADAVATPTPTTLVPPLSIETAHEGYHETSGEQRYTVQAGDTLLTVALETGVDVALLPCAISPTFHPTMPLVIGDQLAIPAATVRCHRVMANETLTTLATLYQTTVDAISGVAWNGLTDVAADAPLPVGRNVQIPIQPTASIPRNAATDAATSSSFLAWMLDQPVDTSPFLALAVGGPFAGQRELARPATDRAVVPANQPGAVPKNWPYGSGAFTWPLTGWLTQGYRYDHRAIDVAAPAGTVVTAADRGVVIRAGWNDQGYGRFVIIDHNIDYITLYAHLNEVLVTEGQVVAQGEVIGSVGSTGNSTGPHLHFEIRDFGRLTNPLELLVQ
jgi:murein DD-endopeptidase MepM/ murein hydrolase activator NlpD